jgi:hypothetical protein
MIMFKPVFFTLPQLFQSEISNTQGKYNEVSENCRTMLNDTKTILYKIHENSVKASGFIGLISCKIKEKGI